ncbi:thiamine phosphate synthase [Pseudaestuariivita sp.]|uniref:thiamine phosphate synthase n=1 Tax=Pseudaestuariivita sp. TaxID=2211669 RepID=UPI004059D1F9
MAEPDTAQVYLSTPSELDLGSFSKTFAAALDTHPVACVRLSLATRDEDRIMRAADALREITHARDVALVIDTHVALVDRLGLDGVHLGDGARSVRRARKDLGADAIVGSFCAASRHEGMTAGEAGADYVAFGPLRPGLLDAGDAVDEEVFAWWSEMIELPVVASGGLDLEAVRRLAGMVDFFSLGDEIWSADDPVATLGSYLDVMR